MEEGKEKKFVCKFCYKTFPSGKSLGGHIRIHSNENSVDSDRYNGNKKKRLVGQREKQQQQQVCCGKCGKGFVSLKALRAHMACYCEGEKMLMDSQSDTESETSSAPTRKRSKRVMDQKHKQQLFCRECDKGFVSLNALSVHMACHSEGEKMLMDSQSDTESETSSAPTRKRSERVISRSNSESCSFGSLPFASETNQEVGEVAYALMMLSKDSSLMKRRNLVMNSLGESSDNNSMVVETKSSSGEELKIFNVKNPVLETDKVVDEDQLRSADDSGVILCDSDGSDSDYFMNGPKNSDSDISVDGSLRNTGFGSGFNNSLKRISNSDKGGSKYELSKSKKVLFSYETDSCADTNSKVHRFRDSKSPVVKKEGSEKKKIKGHECPICFKMFKSGQALGGHKRSHSFANHEHNQVAEMRNQIDLNLPASDTDE